MNTGEKIKILRIKKGLTQKQLGEMCGMADSAIRRYESERANPKLATLQKIAVALNVPIEELYSDTTIDLNRLASRINEWIGNEEQRISNNQLKEQHLIINYRKLNDIGKEEAIKRVAELTEIEKYKKKEGKKKLQAVFKPAEAADPDQDTRK